MTTVGTGSVALVTGGANGIGAGVVRALAGRGVKVVICDVDDAAGKSLADEVQGSYVHCDVSRVDDNEAAVARAEEEFGGLDIVHLNAGIGSNCGFGDAFDLERYRRAMGINLDGVVYGFQAALPALRRRGGGVVVATASMAGLTAVPFDPIYGANKHAVVGLVRAIGAAYPQEGIRVNAVCPGFTDTAILGDARPVLADMGVPIMSVDEVVGAVVTLIEGDMSGQCWYVQPGRAPAPFRFHRLPGPRLGPGPSGLRREAEAGTQADEGAEQADAPPSS